MKKETLTSMEIDQLKEITNIGAGNASTALSTMLGKKVQMSVPESFVGDLAEVQRTLEGKNEKILAVFLKMYGGLDGAMVMIFPSTSALGFIKSISNDKIEKIEDLSEMDFSNIKEVGNILLGASITALGKFLNITILHSIPDAELDMSGAIIDSILAELGGESEEILAFLIKLKIEETGEEGDLYYFFDANSSAKILEMVNKKIK